MVLCTHKPSFIFQLSSHPPDLHGPVIPIWPSIQSLDIVLHVFLQTDNLTLQFRHLGKMDQEACSAAETSE